MKKLLIIVALLTSCALGQTVTQTTIFPKPESRGTYKLYTCSNPAAGAEWSCTVPVGKIWRAISLNVALVTSATVATRAQTIILDDGTSTFYQQTASVTQAASLTYNYVAADLPFAGQNTANVYVLPIPSQTFHLGPGYRIRSSTTAIQVGDDYGAPVLLVEEWER